VKGEQVLRDDKYVVFKRELIDQLKLSDYIMSQVLPDAVVIRTKDPLAGPALHAYAAGAELARRLNPNMSQDDQGKLRYVADYFHARAVEADESYNGGGGIKIPD
jgi:hypothetical protein